MLHRSSTRYAVIDGCHLGYQLVGTGPVDVVLMHQWFTNVDALWDVPAIASLIEELAGFSRVLIFDKRGTGASDPEPPTSEDFLCPFRSDLAYLLDVVGFTQPTLIAGDSATLLAIDFAARHPDRVGGLVVIDGFAHRRGDADGRVRSHIDLIRRMLVDGDGLDLLAPSVAAEPRGQELLARYLRLSVSPGEAAETRRRLLEVDVRPSLPLVQAPTLIVHRAANGFVPAEHGRELADGISTARLVELEGVDGTMFSGNREEIVRLIGSFVGQGSAEPASRRLRAVVFTDIAGSTRRLGELGDAAWVDLLRAFRERARRAIARHQGREVNTRGDDLLASFADPVAAIAYAIDVRTAASEIELSVRSGLHFGSVEDVEEADIGGMVLHIGARIAAAAAAGEVLVSRTVADLLVGSSIAVKDRGFHELRGIDGSWQLFEVATLG